MPRKRHRLKHAYEEGVMKLLKTVMVSVIGLLIGFGTTMGHAHRERGGTALQAIGGGPDLVVKSVAGPASALVGSSLVVTYEVKNQGDDNATGFKVALYLSEDTKIQPSSDRLLKKHALPGLASGATARPSINVTIPIEVAPGAYYLGAKADAQNVVPEASEKNNLMAALKVIPIYAVEQAAVVVDHTTTDLSKIPDYWLAQARKLTFHFAHTSHGGQLLTGLEYWQARDPKYAYAIQLRVSPKAADRQRSSPHL